MLKLFYGQRGAVTVFLTLILVPVIVVCTCFIDLSRVKLAQGMVKSAGDLAMNTALTSFDQTLNEIYGLLASCQSREEVVDSVDRYFMESLSSRELETSQVQQFIKSLNNLLGKAEETEEVNDLLCITMNDGSFALEEVENGNLTNPAVIKEQIVNFMKYRSVIDGTQELVAMLTESANAAKNVKENSEMIKAQQDAAEAEEEALDKLKVLYHAIKDYQDMKITKEYVEEIVNEDMREIQDKYYQAHVFTVKNTLNYKSYMDKFDYTVKINPNIEYSVKEKPGTGDFKKTLKDYNRALTEYINCTYKDPDNNLYDIIEHSITDRKPHYLWQHFIQKYQKLNDSGILARYIEAADNLVKNYNIMLATKNAMNANGIFTDDSQILKMKTYEYPRNIGDQPYASWSESSSPVEKTYQEWYEYFTGGDLAKNLFEVLQEDFSTPGGLYEQLYRHMSYYTKPENNSTYKNTVPYNRMVKEVYQRLKGDENSILKTLWKAKNKLHDAKGKIDGARNAVRSYVSSMETWKEKIDHSSSEFSTDQRAILQEMQTEKGSIYGKVTELDLNELEDRMSELENNLNSLITVFDEMQYGGKKLKNIKDYNTLKSRCASFVNESEIPVNENDLTHFCDHTFLADGNKGFKVDFIDIEWIKSKSPDLEEDSAPDQPAVYGVLLENFKDKTENDEKKDEHKKYKDKSKDTSDSKENVKRDDTSTPYLKSVDTQLMLKTNRPSDGLEALTKETELSGNLDEAGEEADNFFSEIQKVLSNILTSCRDQLFVTDYIMSMFTYDTYTNEQLYRIASDIEEEKKSGKKLNSLSETKAMLASPSDEIKTLWESEKATDTWNKTITNQMMSTANNYSYGNEVEYILYGGLNENNKLKAWASIFAIQFAMNSIYGVGEFWSPTKTDTGMAIEGVAQAIFAGTGGIVPVAVSKVVLIMALVAAETAHDISCLKAGMPVALLKDEYTWFYSWESVEKSLTDASSEGKSTGAYDPAASGKWKFTYSNYLSIFLFVKQISGNSAKGIYLRTADVIQANMQLRLNKSDGENAYLLKKSKTYYRLKADFTVHPLMLQLPVVLNSGMAEDNPKDNANWYTISYEEIRGYY